MGSATAAMAAVNQHIDPVLLQQTMNKFSNEMEKISMAEESWDDMVDAFDGDGIEDESDQVLNQVLDELGLEVGNSLANISAPPSSNPISTTFDEEVINFFSTIFTSSQIIPLHNIDGRIFSNSNIKKTSSSSIIIHCLFVCLFVLL